MDDFSFQMLVMFLLMSDFNEIFFIILTI